MSLVKWEYESSLKHRSFPIVSVISPQVWKTDGAHPSQQGVRKAVMERKKKGPRWDGEAGTHKECSKKQSTPPTQSSVQFEAAAKSGRPTTADASLVKKIVRLVFRSRGSVRVTVAFLKKKVVAARRLGTRTLQRKLCDAGLAWLRRRRKTFVSKEYKAPRTAFARWVLARQSRTLQRWAYSDGTAFYLARTEPEKGHKKRGALGVHMWRMANGSDGMYEEEHFFPHRIYPRIM